MEPRNIRVLVACEFSGRVRDSFTKRGFDAWSCDILPTESPGNHIQDDILKHLDDGWDLMIAHPPCTYLCVPGAHYLHKQPDRWTKIESAKSFFLSLFNANIPAVAIENPLPHHYANLPHYSQIVNPWMFGEEQSKRTCLWLRNLPPLFATKWMPNHGERYTRTLSQQMRGYGKSSNSKWYASSSARERSITFPGIADAMADQWGNYLLEEYKCSPTQ